MNVQRILTPWPDERALAIDPPLGIRVADDWRRRVRAFAGRALVDTALGIDPALLAARAALAGQALEPGWISGLEARWERQAGVDFVSVAAGFGIASSGEDLHVFIPIRLPIASLPVRTLSAAMSPTDHANLADYAIAEGAGEFAAALVLQPVVFDEPDPAAALLDQCEPDPADAAFLDERIAEGCRLILVVWPTAWQALPALAEPNPWRSAVARAVFDAEAKLGVDEWLPWEAFGLPVAILGFKSPTEPIFLDRHAVSRPGGGRKRPRTPTGRRQLRGLRRAQILQFVEQLAESFEENPSTFEPLPADFPVLPPFGLLPIDPDDRDRYAKSLFPKDAGNLDVVVAPVEELDAIASASAGLSPIDPTVGGEVRVIVPVAGSVYEPDLLKTEAFDPAPFDSAITAFKTRRNKWRLRRDDVRKLLFARAQRSLSGKAPVFADDAAGTDEVPDDSAIDTQDPDLADKEISDNASLVDLASMKTLETALIPLIDVDKIKKLSSVGLYAFLPELQAQLDQADDRIDLGFLRVQTDMYRIRQFLLGDDTASRLATSPALAEIARGVTARTTKLDLKDYFAASKAGPKVNKDSPRPLGKEPGASGIFSSPKSPRTSEAFAARGDLAATFSLAGANRANVTDQAAIVGRDYGFRTATIAERLAVSPALEAKDFAVSTKHDVLSSLNDIDFARDVQVPGFAGLNNTGRLEIGKAAEPELLKTVLAGKFDPDPANGDEAAFLSAGVATLDGVISALRLVEGRVRRYRQALDLCRKAVTDLEALKATAQARLTAIDAQLAQARQDAEIGEALKRDEQERVKAINERRIAVLKEHVKFLAFFRPRIAPAWIEPPQWRLDPLEVAAPVPGCLGRSVAIPPELQAYVELFRQAPSGWFTQMPRWFPMLDRIDLVRRVLDDSRRRAVDFLDRKAAARSTWEFLSPADPPTGATGLAIRSVALARLDSLGAARLGAIDVDLGQFGRATWSDLVGRARSIVTLGDLISGGHGRPDLARAAASELDQIGHVAGCLYDGLQGIRPVLRLIWAEGLGQYDGHASLRNLAGLPRWGEVPSTDRRRFQAMVDWLYSRIDLAVPAAVSLVDDLVRVAILVASHAPVDRIIAARIPRPTTARPGGLIEIAVDVGRARVGMTAEIFRGNKIVARGHIEDLKAEGASVRIRELTEGGVRLDLLEDARVNLITGAIA